MMCIHIILSPHKTFIDVFPLLVEHEWSVAYEVWSDLIIFISIMLLFFLKKIILPLVKKIQMATTYKVDGRETKRLPKPYCES